MKVTTRFFAAVFACVAIFFNCLFSSPVAFAAGADYDGNGFSEIPVLVQSAGRGLEWKLFDPSSGATTTFLPNFGKVGNGIIIANWLYPTVTSAGVLSKPSAASKGRMVWTIRTNVVPKRGGAATIKQHKKFLGRPADKFITGGDFDGDGVSDAVVLANRGTRFYKWGLRSNFFLASYNPTLHVNRAYFDFGIRGKDLPFYLNPDGKSDWFAVLRNSGSSYNILMTQPFTRETRTIQLGSLADGSHPPIPLQQDDGSDYLVFWAASANNINIVVKDLQGQSVYSTDVPIAGTVTVGNYGAGPGEEIAVSGGGRFFIINPISGRIVELSGPSGTSADAVNIN
jgi:hypothetical protein